jgi:ribosome biogenesis GTPase / thiamine phosphate phosphatase
VIPGDGALEALGWGGPFDAFFAPHREAGLAPARVIAEHRGSFAVSTGDREFSAAVSGRLRHEALLAADFPAVGDWVAIEIRAAEGAATIHAVLPRRSAILRDAGDDARRGGADDQVLAANVDVALLVAPIDRALNLRRLERYVALAWASGTEPVIVLSKADLAADQEAAIAEAERVAPGVSVHATSAPEGAGLLALAAHLQPGRTSVVLGPSGAGKSTLVNALLGRTALATGAIRESDGRGRHTTSHRELLVLPGGALLIDTPGLRSIGLVSAGDGLTAVFDDIEALVAGCRFPDCSHGAEPGCGVQAALDDGSLDRGRFEGYRKLQREEAHARRERDPRARLAERKKWKQIHAAVGRHMDAKYGGEWR